MYHGPDDECTRQKSHKRLVATYHRKTPPHSSPPMFPPSVLKVLLSVCLRLLGLGIGGESSLRPPASPPLLPFFFSFLLFPLFDLRKPPSFIHSASSLLPHTLRVQDLCLCVCVFCLVVCNSCNRANLIPVPPPPPTSCVFPSLPCVCSLAWRGAHSHVRVVAGWRYGRGRRRHGQGLGWWPARMGVGLRVSVGVGHPW